MATYWDPHYNTNDVDAFTVGDISDWDLLQIGGQYVPGIVQVDAQPTLAVQKLRKPGSDGATHVIRGYDPGPINFKVTLWTPDHLSSWQDLLKSIWPRPGKDNSVAAASSKASFTVSHPALDVMGISQVTIIGVSSLAPSGPQVFSATIRCLEFFPTKANGKVTHKESAAKVIPVSSNVKGTKQAGTDTNSSGQSVPPDNATQSLPSQSQSFTGPNG